ncbi:MAG: hypothetical protein V3V31_10815 [Methylococcales bacterium]
MLFSIFQYRQDLPVDCFQKKIDKKIARFTGLLFLSVTFGFSNIQAADFSCTWTGGALNTGNWTSPTWNSDPGCSGTFPHNNGATFDATHSIGTIRLDRDITIETFNLAGGTLTGSNKLTVNKIFNWSRGTLSGTGSIHAAGGLELTGNVFFKDSATVINAEGQVANWSQGNITLLRGESGFVNEANANFNITGDDKRMLGLRHIAKFDNDGTVTANMDSVENSVGLNLTVNNRGLVKIEKGELRLGGGGISSGLFELGEQGGLNFRGGQHVLEASSSITGSNVTFSQSGATDIDGTYIVEKTELKPGGKANFNAETSITTTLTMSGGNVSGSGTLLVGGDANFRSGEMTGTGVTAVFGNLDINGNFAQIRDDRRLFVVGQGSWSSGTFLLRNEGSGLFIQPGASFKIEADKGRNFGLGAIVNQGVLEVNLAEGAEPVIIKSNLTNLGSFILQGGNLIMGSVLPTNQLISRELALFNGSFLQGETGTTFFDISGRMPGEEFDVLNILENAFLSGTFDITLKNDPANPFVLAPGDSFDILTAKTVVLNGLVLGGVDGDLFNFGVVNLDAGNQALRISVGAVPIPAAIWLFLSALLGIWRLGIRRSR